jgi:LytS/YehU family sensor histidine kinase
VFAQNQSLAASKLIQLPDDECLQAPLLYAGREVGCISVFDPGKRKIDPQIMQLAVELAQFVVEYHLRLRELQEQTEAVSRTELKALQAQVHPHFLFNALNTLAALCQIDARQANRLTVRLGEFLRSSLQATAQDVVSLEREMSVVRSYLEIEKARFQDMLVIEERVDADTEEVFVPPFALQTLVENSVVHGIANKVSPGHLTLVARIKGDRLVCWVIDDGEQADETATGKRRPGPHGLEILQARLKNIYGDTAGLRLRKRSSGGMIALLWMSTGRINS